MQPNLVLGYLCKYKSGERDFYMHFSVRTGKAPFVWVLTMAITIPFYGQNENSATTATGRGAIVTSNITDYQALSINPANLALPENPKLAFGLAEFNLSLYSEAFPLNDLKALMFNPSQLPNYNASQLAAMFSGARNSMDLNVMPFGFSLYGKKLGGLAFGIRQNLMATSYFNQGLSNLIFNGFHYTDYIDSIIVTNTGDTIGISFQPVSASELFDSSRITLSATTDIVVGYGREIVSNDNIRLYAGVGFQYVIGYAMIDAGARDHQLSAFTAITPGTGIDFGNLTAPSLDTSGQFRPAGKGFGFDVGLNLSTSYFQVGMSLTQLGSVTWSANVFEMKDFTVDSIDFSGLDSTIFNSQIHLVDVSGLADKKVPLPSKFRMGISSEIIDKLHIGMDIAIPLNQGPGNLIRPFVGLGMDYDLLNFLTVSSGMTFGGNYRFDVPLGIRFHIGPQNKGYELAVATRDVLTFFGADRPNLSFGMAALRFKF